MRRFLAMKRKWGFSKFISKKELTDPSSGYLVNDSCVFGAEVFVNRNTAVAECLILKIDEVPYKQEFKIENFSKSKCKWTSGEFTAGGCKWKLDVYPNGVGEASGHFLSIYLNHVASNDHVSCKRVKACYTICLKNQASDKDHAKGSDWFSAPEDDNWGWLEFIELDSMNDPNRGFIVKDCCLLEIELAVQAISA
ncbi:math domain and coiled-coil domain-containing protein at3g58210 [Phtheirospermum japonicum]|uniref:Math domain and coiled-coil domain-containing protein at3g58210 n=1 Tax=Phtheirospermum japonicum TaxID=374723 RepID=A0A830CQI1_9LAMI|nr:math domain and coiled-coil domain-containing protein at3g58210 [Phtheirospermum japonicum]